MKRVESHFTDTSLLRESGFDLMPGKIDPLINDNSKIRGLLKIIIDTGKFSLIRSRLLSFVFTSVLRASN